MKIIVDTNIVFNGILNSNNQIGKILINSNKHFEFYSCDFLKVEIQKHQEKLLKLTKLSKNELHELEMLVTSNIKFLNEGLIPNRDFIDLNHGRNPPRNWLYDLSHSFVESGERSVSLSVYGRTGRKILWRERKIWRE